MKKSLGSYVFLDHLGNEFIDYRNVYQLEFAKYVAMSLALKYRTTVFVYCNHKLIGHVPFFSWFNHVVDLDITDLIFLAGGKVQK